MNPPNLRIGYRRDPLPASDNALPLWQAAAEALRAIEPSEEACNAESGSCCVVEEVSSVSPDQRQRRIQAIEMNQKALDLIDAGIERGCLQFPEITNPEHFGVGLDLVVPWRDLCRVRRWRVDQALADGDAPQAVRDVIALIRFGDMICNADGIVVHYLVGTGFRRSGTDALLRLTSQPLPQKRLAELLDAVNLSAKSRDGLEQAMIVDFDTTALPLVDRVPDAAHHEELIDSLFANFYHNESSGLIDEPVPDAEARLAWRRDRLLQVVHGHPRPFDKAVTIDMMKWRLAEALEEINSPWLPPLTDFRARFRRWLRQWSEHRLRRTTSRWPFQLTPACFLEGLGESDQASRWLAEMAGPVGRRWFSLYRPLTDGDVPRVRRSLRAIRNPVGLLLVEHSTPFLHASSMLQHRLYLVACQTLLATRIFQSEHGRSPTALSELVHSGIIPAIPQDPYSRRALRYSAEKMLLWSVGQDGLNREGQLDHSPSYAPGFRVRWQVSMPATPGESPSVSDTVQ